MDSNSTCPVKNSKISPGPSRVCTSVCSKEIIKSLMQLTAEKYVSGLSDYYRELFEQRIQDNLRAVLCYTESQQEITSLECSLLDIQQRTARIFLHPMLQM